MGAIGRTATTAEVDVDDRTDYQPIVGSKYLAVGYPHMLADAPKEKSVFSAQPVFWTGNPRRIEVAHDLKKVYESSHVLVDFEADRVGAEFGLNGPLDPEGMSGGGLYRFGSLVRGSTADDKLVGILIEKHIETRSAILASRLAFVFEGIRLRLPHLSPYLPSSRSTM